MVNQTAHGFVRSPDGKIEEFDPPNSTTTDAAGFNDSGIVTGSYFDGKRNLFHAFIRIP